ncbi:segregation and condensation protein B [Leucobacter exalbidus]|uniref:Segregation and condensation protein B n=1 Tax=Leucobacter exalbidus TaxID=662960 RepID=A0A940PSF9_9MICO|nr:SMC-Scp complex subunit ScpB [Leucobacter exalbidus]MBP1325932.1 segregation and condensation protein B [Leucobacter exalbidus]
MSELERGETDEVAELATVRSTHSLTQQLEALLIVAEQPQDAIALAAAVDRPVAEVRAALAALIADYDGVGLQEGSGAAGARSGSSAEPGSVAREPRGFELREVSGGFRFYVRASLDLVVADAVRQERSAKLSQAALETLAVIAYRQPVTRGQVAQIRAVNVDSVVRTLLSHSLIEEAGHHEETGATLYGTTDVLLDRLGIGDISELPHISPLLDDGAEGFEHELL